MMIILKHSHTSLRKVATKAVKVQVIGGEEGGRHEPLDLSMMESQEPLWCSMGSRWDTTIGISRKVSSRCHLARGPGTPALPSGPKKEYKCPEDKEQSVTPETHMDPE